MEKRRTLRLLSLALVCLFVVCVAGHVSTGQGVGNVCTICVEDGVLSIKRDGREPETYALDGRNKAVLRIQGDRVTVSFAKDEAPFQQSFEFVGCDAVWDDAKTAYAKDRRDLQPCRSRQKIDAALGSCRRKRGFVWQSFNFAPTIDQAPEAMDALSNRCRY